jgi:hypothetical protein
MRVLAHLRGTRETSYRELGIREIDALPPKGSYVTLIVDGKSTRARVVDRSENLPSEERAPGYLNLFLESA